MDGIVYRVLLVEDNDDHAALLERSFEEHCSSMNIFKRVSDGHEALDYLYNKEQFSDKTENTKPQLIFLDIRLPKVDGLEVLRIIKEDKDLREIPVIILTSSQSAKDLLKAYENYVNSYLVKPLNYEKFTELVKSLGMYWANWNITPERVGVCFD